MASNAGRRPSAHGVCLLLLFAFAGCGKTPDTQNQDSGKQKAESKTKGKEKIPFEAGSPDALPGGPGFAGSCKPGHWISQVWPQVKDNQGDFQGGLQTQISDREGHRVPLVASPYEMTEERLVTLAKEQPKSLESCTWIPSRRDASSVNFKLASGAGDAAIERSMPLMPMPSYRYYFVVLSQAAGRYEYLDHDKHFSSIRERRAKADADLDAESVANAGPETGAKFYEVVTMPASKRPSLPADPLYWTSIAYLLWDDSDTSKWDVDQQRALIDWLHWGGQIIVSGHAALEQLRSSFLGPYLPATVEKTRSLSEGDLAELSYWAGEVGVQPKTKGWQGGQLKKDPRAEFLPYTGDLVVERQVGRGRIVASSFRLTGPELTGWPGFDSFFNACLLRRPPRIFPAKDAENAAPRWADRKTNSPWLDAAKMTGVRYFARDAGVEYKKYAADEVAAERLVANPGLKVLIETAAEVDVDSWGRAVGPGLGAWNDFSPVAQAARAALKNASGIKVPDRNFVVWMLAGYLFVLVPANWLVFRLLGRVEWAWIAAPLIAIGCTVLVIQQAQLNIGFARSRNEIAVIEMQPGYSRAHVARYTALYTSLATSYELRLGSPAGQILPFPKVSSPKEFTTPDWQTRGELVCRRGEDTRVSGFDIGSNVVDYVHSEEMADFGGTVALRQDADGTLWVTNGTGHLLDRCQAVRGNPSGIAADDLGRLEPGETKALKFASAGLSAIHQPTSTVHDAGPSGELSLAGITDVAFSDLELRPGEICLVAQVDGLESGLTVTPAPQENRQVSLLVAHLTPGSLPVPEADSQEKPAPPPTNGTSGPILPGLPIDLSSGTLSVPSFDPNLQPKDVP